MIEAEEKELWGLWYKERRKKLKGLNKNALIDSMLKLELSIIKMSQKEEK